MRSMHQQQFLLSTKVCLQFPCSVLFALCILVLWNSFSASSLGQEYDSTYYKNLEHGYRQQANEGYGSRARSYPFGSGSASEFEDYGYRASFPKVKDPDIYEAKYEDGGDYRQPSAIAFVDSQTAVVTTRLTGEIYQLSWSDKALKSTFHDPERTLAAVVRLDEKHIAVADLHKSEILIFESFDGSKAAPEWRIIHRLSAPGEPNKLVWDDSSKSLLASGKWSQRLYRWKLIGAGKSMDFRQWNLREAVDLPMCGGEILWLHRHQVILVADAFGRRFVTIDPDDFEVVHKSSFYGHNIKGLAATTGEEMIFFPHQLLNEIARSERTDITWGGLMSNNIRWLLTDRVLNLSGEQIFNKGKFLPSWNSWKRCRRSFQHGYFK